MVPKFSVEPIHPPLFPGQCQGLAAAARPPGPGTWNFSAWIQLVTKEQWSHSGMTLREPGSFCGIRGSAHPAAPPGTSARSSPVNLQI